MILEHAKILEIHQLAVVSELSDARRLLLFGLDVTLVAKIALQNAPSDQLLEDLNHLNYLGRQGKTLPLAVWLANASNRVNTKWPERAARFKEWQEQALAAAPQGWLGISSWLPSARPTVIATQGGLNAAAKQALVSAMAACLLVEDLQTAAERCFGSLPIGQTGAGQAPAVRDVALQCLELAEREKMTPVFSRAVLQLERCDAPLGQQLRQLYPELLDAERPFAEIVDAASSFLSLNAAKVSALLGNAPLMPVAKLRCYKGLHEALHQFRNNPLPRIPEQSSPQADHAYRQDVRQFLALLHTAQDRSSQALAELAPDNEVRVAETPWATLIGGYAQRIATVLDADAIDLFRLESEVDRTWASLNRLEEFNERIIELARELLNGPLATLRDALAADSQASPVLQQAMTAIDALRLALHVRVLEHTRWQETNSFLVSLDGTLQGGAAVAFTKFTRQWGVVRRQLPVLSDAEGKIDLARLRQLAQRVDGALTRIEGALGEVAGNGAPAANGAAASTDPMLVMSEPYDAFRFEAQQQFLRVDAALKRNCAALAKIV